MKRYTCAASLLLGIAAGLATADEPQALTDTAKIDFGTLDKDSSGGLTKEEVKAVAELEREFQNLDADHNNLVSAPEFQRWHRAGKTTGDRPKDPATAPGGSAGAQHMPETD